MLSLAVLASGRGSNLQSIVDAINQKQLDAKINVVIGSKDNIFALEIAKQNNIKTYVVSKNDFQSPSDEILKIVRKENVDLIVLAGYLGILRGEILSQYKNKIINVHPSLIPCFCGEGMYGMKVHEAVKKSGVEKTGCTVHYVTDVVDGGNIIVQREVTVEKNDSPETIAQRVLCEEHKAIVEAIKIITEEQ